MTTVLRLTRHNLLLLSLLTVTFPIPAHAQAAGPRTSYWLTAGAGWALASNDRSFTSDNGSAVTGAASLQRGVLVLSARGVRTTAGTAALWDAGVLAGVGSPTRYRMRGSIGAGFGRINGPGISDWTLPLELQLAWRVSPRVAVAAYGFGSFTGPREILGATLAVQIGRWE